MAKPTHQDCEALMRADEKERLLAKAEELALANRAKGFHCSESVFSAINQTLRITDPAMVRMVTGFHGGGGARRKEPGIDLTAALEKVASGQEQRPREEWGFEVTGHICGALASGIICIGLLYGRRRPDDDLTCADELTSELHRRFEAKFESKICREIREKIVPASENNTCEFVYQKGSRMAVELILESGELVDRCPGYSQP